MSRESDLKWFLEHRQELSDKFPGQWLIVDQGDVRKVFKAEEEAIEYSINTFGVNVASVFQAVPRDPFVYIGGTL